MLLYFEWREKIWGGSPATEQILSRVETVDLDEPSEPSEETHDQLSNTDPSSKEGDAVNATPPEQASGGEPTSLSGVQQRRALLDNKLSNYKQEKLKRKLPMDSQLVDCAKEDIAVKKRLLDQMDRMDQQYSDNMSKLSSTMDRLTDSIADGFSLLRGLLLPQQSVFPPQQPMYRPPQPIYQPPQQVLYHPSQQQPMFSGHQQPMFGSPSNSSEDTSRPTTPPSQDEHYTF